MGAVATCNVLTYRNLSIFGQDCNPSMKASNSKLKLFDGSFIKPLGSGNLRVTHDDQTEMLKFQVVGG